MLCRSGSQRLAQACIGADAAGHEETRESGRAQRRHAFRRQHVHYRLLKGVGEVGARGTCCMGRPSGAAATTGVAVCAY